MARFNDQFFYLVVNNRLYRCNINQNGGDACQQRAVANADYYSLTVMGETVFLGEPRAGPLLVRRVPLLALCCRQPAPLGPSFPCIRLDVCCSSLRRVACVLEPASVCASSTQASLTLPTQGMANGVVQMCNGKVFDSCLYLT